MLPKEYQKNRDCIVCFDNQNVGIRGGGFYGRGSGSDVLPELISTLLSVVPQCEVYIPPLHRVHSAECAHELQLHAFP